MEANTALKSSWDEKMRRKAEIKKVVDLNRKIKEDKIKKIKAETERLKNKAKLKELNTFKSSTFQIVILFDFFHFVKIFILQLDKK